MTGIASQILNRLDKQPSESILVGNKACARETWTAGEIAESSRFLAAGLSELGLRKGCRIGMIADNCDHWLIADLGSLLCGFVTVPRARDTAPDEVQFILEHSACQAVFIEDAKLLASLTAKLRDLAEIRTIILLKGKAESDFDGPQELTDLEQLMARGKSLLNDNPSLVSALEENVTESDLATIVYTSGTTGNPKGVRLSHGNILHNLRTIPQVIELRPEDRYLSFLPTWHSFERTLEYCLLQAGSTIHYSSKTRLRKDMPKVKPTIIAGVPRLWETLASSVMGSIEKLSGAKRALVDTALAGSRKRVDLQRQLDGLLVDSSNRIAKRRGLSRLMAGLRIALLTPCDALANALVYKKLRGGLGGEVRFLVSGGGALQAHVDEFFNRARVCILNGYGLTETAPVVSLRVPSNNVLQTAGKRLPETEWRVRNEDNTETLATGKKGVLWIKGPQIMDGYHNNEEATKKVLQEGWFSSGDLAALTDEGHVLIQGRAKDTIVLRGGENVEPELIESPLLQIPFVKDVLLVGHGEKHLSALIVPDPETLATKLPGLDPEDLVAAAKSEEVGALIHEAIREALSSSHGFRVFEQVPKIALLKEAFSTENGTLTLTMKKRRPAIEELYGDLIAEIYKDGSPAVTHMSEPEGT